MEVTLIADSTGYELVRSHPSLYELLRRCLSVVETEAERSSNDDGANDENAHDPIPRYSPQSEDAGLLP